MMDGWGGGMGAGGWALMIIFWIALVALIGLAIVRLFPSSSDGGAAHDDPAGKSPERVLDERLARGEIDVETYERLREVLSRGAPRG
jgi:putative membrane protein